MEPECVADTRDYIKRGGAVGASDPKLVRTSYILAQWRVIQFEEEEVTKGSIERPANEASSVMHHRKTLVDSRDWAYAGVLKSFWCQVTINTKSNSREDEDLKK